MEEDERKWKKDKIEEIRENLTLKLEEEKRRSCPYMGMVKHDFYYFKSLLNRVQQ